ETFVDEVWMRRDARLSEQIAGLLRGARGVLCGFLFRFRNVAGNCALLFRRHAVAKRYGRLLARLPIPRGDVMLVDDDPAVALALLAGKRVGVQPFAKRGPARR